MKLPPLGYDDETIVPSVRMRFTIERLLEEFKKIESIFKEKAPGEFTNHAHFAQDFENLLKAANELEETHVRYVQNLIDDYALFSAKPDSELLQKLFNDLKNLQILLEG